MSKDRFDSLDEKVDKLDSRLDNIDKTLAVNTESLIHHIARTDAIEDQVKPLVKAHLMWVAGIKICGAALGLSSFIVVVLRLLGKIH